MGEKTLWRCEYGDPQCVNIALYMACESGLRLDRLRLVRDFRPLCQVHAEAWCNESDGRCVRRLGGGTGDGAEGGLAMDVRERMRTMFTAWYFLPDGTPYRGAAACGHGVHDPGGIESIATMRLREPRMHFVNMPDVPVETMTAVVTSDVDGRPVMVLPPVLPVPAIHTKDVEKLFGPHLYGPCEHCHSLGRDRAAEYMGCVQLMAGAVGDQAVFCLSCANDWVAKSHRRFLRRLDAHDVVRKQPPKVVDAPAGPTRVVTFSDESGPALRNDAPPRAVKIEHAPGTVRELASLLVAERAAMDSLAVDEWHSAPDRAAAKQTLATVRARLAMIAVESDAPEESEDPAAPEPKVGAEERAAHDVAAVDIAKAAIARAPRCGSDEPRFGCGKSACWKSRADGEPSLRCDEHRDVDMEPLYYAPELKWLEVIAESGRTMGFPLTTIAEVGRLVAKGDKP